MAVERELGIVAAEFLAGAGGAGFGDGDELGHGGGEVGDWNRSGAIKVRHPHQLV